VAAGRDDNSDLEQQRANIESDFREGWKPVDAGQPRVLTDHAYTEARKIIERGGWTGLDSSTIQAVRDGARPGDPLLPLMPKPFISNVADAEVILTGTGSGQHVAVLFHHADFAGIRFGHRFVRPGDALARYASIWLKEEIETGALHTMMGNPPPADRAGVVWTIWGSQAT
jgi:hypothetical protein